MHALKLRHHDSAKRVCTSVAHPDGAVNAVGTAMCVHKHVT